jgi:hypothetical protein
MLPSSELRSFRGAPIARNAFALDFLKHAQVTWLIRCVSGECVCLCGDGERWWMVSGGEW